MALKLVDTALELSLLFVLLDWFVLGIHTGFRLSEYAQRKGVNSLSGIQRNIDMRPKALIAKDFTFYGHNQMHMSQEEAIQNPADVDSVNIRWREQKNGIKNKEKTVVKNERTRSLCAVTAAVQIIK